MTINEKINQIYDFIFAGHDKNIIMKLVRPSRKNARLNICVRALVRIW